MLRDYQRRAIDQLYSWFNSHDYGNPCLVLPTGAGKSHIVAALCKEAVQSWSGTKILMLTHVKELIEQNASKLRQHWPNAPLGIFSAGLRRTNIDQITFGGIQSLRNKAELIGHVDLVIIDECFTGETLISTPSGKKRIDEMRCGDIVYNQSGIGFVEAVSTKLSNDIYEVKINDGRSIRCTGNHPFFTEKGWVKCSELENGANLFSIEDMLRLWESVQTLDKAQSRRVDKIGNVRTELEQAAILLSEVCEEIQPNSTRFSGKSENQQNTKGDKTQTYKSWRERAVANLAAACTPSRAGRWMDSRNVCANKDGAQEWNIPESLQDRHCEQEIDDRNRDRRRQSRNIEKEGNGFKEGSAFGSVRVESVSSIKSESARTVFNLQVSGHPSYFAGGVAVHNCHLINNNQQGGYRSLLAALEHINPSLRVIGLTATPYRLGQGKLTEGDDALFHDIIEPVDIAELVANGYLAPLKSKHTYSMIDVSKAKKRGGEYVAKDIENAAEAVIESAIGETITRAEGREHWLIFCSGVQNAQHAADLLNRNGIPAGCLTGKNTKTEREAILEAFTSGKLKALTNANILTTGFDYPDIDLIAMLRPTMSASLYVQMAGRGMRLKSHTDHCLVLDFAGNVETHGPVTNVRPPKARGEGGGETPVKVCPDCFEQLLISVKECPECGHEFKAEPKPMRLSNADIMGIEPMDMAVTDWKWSAHTSRTSGKEMIKVKYYGGLSDPVITEYFPITHGGSVERRAYEQLQSVALNAGLKGAPTGRTMKGLADWFNTGTHPQIVRYTKNGKFYEVKNRLWQQITQTG